MVLSTLKQKVKCSVNDRRYKMKDKKKFPTLLCTMLPYGKVKMSFRLTSLELCHENTWASGCRDPSFLDPGGKWSAHVPATLPLEKEQPVPTE
jgi:hypothetical protein